ncbi:unnamed protein product [Caenorhabditis angaria]|uniref:Aminopeptidase P N-terminal domain-containing protein n=1 Tax=Caenorhabditis angaria TaxID=860376 RepID=A0A9P1MUF1_9PELO|nr:unnamed protein product [Caenorhabditis angaria]
MPPASSVPMEKRPRMVDKLASVRGFFNAENVRKVTNNSALAAYFLPSTDAHNSEYLAEYDFRVKFLSNFSGSNAQVVITPKKALLWTDGRYYVQANRQLSKEWEMKTMNEPDSITVTEFLISELRRGDFVGFDPTLLSFDSAETMRKKLKGVGIHLVAVDGNLVDPIWANRPSLGHKKVTVLTKQEHGKETSVKIKELREKLVKKKCTAAIYTVLDDIVWLLNIRGFDITYNPLVYSYLLVTAEKVVLFIDESKLDETSTKHLIDSKVDIQPYESTFEYLKNWNSTTPDQRIHLSPATNYAIGSIFGVDNIVTDTSFAQIAKAQKNDIEMEGMRQSHIRDSAALVEFLVWFENEMLAGNEYSEIELAKRLDTIRSRQEKYVDLSFSTISAFGDHAALPHYHPEGEDGQRKANSKNVYLVDSGAHYRDGTTDVTRTVWYTNPSSEFIKSNSLVLKGHISLAQTVFPSGIMGGRLDTLSRHALWQQGLDFSHGTGHGVGHFLNVHEGPIGIGISTAAARPGGELKVGQVITIEPGYYLPGSYGIRIENCYETVKTSVPSGADNFLGFKTLTLVPIQTSIIDKSIFTESEINWLNEYHSEVLEKTGKQLLKNGKTREYEWLKTACKHI